MLLQSVSFFLRRKNNLNIYIYIFFVANYYLCVFSTLLPFSFPLSQICVILQLALFCLHLSLFFMLINLLIIRLDLRNKRRKKNTYSTDHCNCFCSVKQYRFISLFFPALSFFFFFERIGGLRVKMRGKICINSKKKLFKFLSLYLH